MQTTTQTPLIARTSASSSAVVAAFLDRIRTGEFDDLEELFAPDVWMRSLLVRTVREANNSKGVVHALREWLASTPDRRMLEAESGTMAGREYLRYRFLLRPDWDTEHWYLIEQVGYCKVADGRITRLDLVCTGYHRAD